MYVCIIVIFLFHLLLLLLLILLLLLCVEDLDEDEWIGDEDDEDKPRVGARPQRGIHIKTKVKPIPPASSLFVFSSTNPYELITL